MAKCNCVYEPFCSMLNGSDIILPTPCEYRKDSTNFVEVVRCKDCKHYKPPKVSAHFINHTPYCTRVVTMKVKPDDFCSYGERRSNEG